MQTITPYLWFDTQAEEAMNYYVSIFKNSRVGDVQRFGEAGPGPAGTVMACSFVLDGQEFMALNGGPMFNFTEAISFFVNCETQEDVDYLWDKLTDGGEEQPCGWLKDKFGVSWQVIPSALGGLISGPDPEGAARAVRAMLQMKKIDIATLQRAYDGE
jgi:predicted 3-demethylubiquinone-9 3-methyltransferase (glyoxalase superfamily)